MTDLLNQIAVVSRLQKDATPGPWHIEPKKLRDEVYISTDGKEPRLDYAGWNGLLRACGCEEQPIEGMQVALANGRFVAAARNLDFSAIYAALTAAAPAISLTDGGAGSQWVSVEERLPRAYITHARTGLRVSDTVIVAQRGKTLLEPHYRREDNQWFAGSFATPDITHWMPLPENPAAPTSNGN